MVSVSVRTRIEVNDQGELYVVIPEEFVEDLQLTEGEVVEIDEDEGCLILTF